LRNSLYVCVRPKPVRAWDPFGLTVKASVGGFCCFRIMVLTDGIRIIIPL
jgi:hypothetical protein